MIFFSKIKNIFLDPSKKSSFGIDDFLVAGVLTLVATTGVLVVIDGYLFYEIVLLKKETPQQTHTAITLSKDQLDDFEALLHKREEGFNRLVPIGQATTSVTTPKK